MQLTGAQECMSATALSSFPASNSIWVRAETGFQEPTQLTAGRCTSTRQRKYREISTAFLFTVLLFLAH
jgi:hypothetical protein